MANRLQYMTDKPSGNFKKKDKQYIDAVYNMSEMVKAVQIYYDQTYPTGSRLGRDRIRAMIMFFLDTIIHSVDRGARVTLTGFGSFRKKYIGEAYFPENVHGTRSYRAPFNKVMFNASGRFKDILNNRDQTAFEDNSAILDELHDFDNPPPTPKTDD